MFVSRSHTAQIVTQNVPAYIDIGFKTTTCVSTLITDVGVFRHSGRELESKYNSSALLVIRIDGLHFHCRILHNSIVLNSSLSIIIVMVSFGVISYTLPLF